MTKPILEFQGKYRFLSNFYPRIMKHGGILWPTSEHAYQASKMLYADDFIKVLMAETPGRAKRLGQKLTIRSNWDAMKLEIMKLIQASKFTDPLLKGALLGTEDAHLEEGNKWGDTFWGACDGVGKNHLGKILMEVREEIRNG